MADIKSVKTTELTPATLENMPVGQKITAYEQILNDQALYTKKIQDIEKQGNKVLEAAGISFAPYLQKDAVKVFKKRNVDTTIYAFAQRIGKDVSSIIANGSTNDTTLEEYLGKDNYAKLKAIAEEYFYSGV